MQKSIVSLLVIMMLLLVGLLLGYFVFLKPDSAAEKQVFINANVITMNQANEIVQAIALDGDTIVAVGSNADIQVYIDENTQVHDLEGKTLLPGFVDAHSHFPGFGLGDITVDLNSPPIGSVQSIADIQLRLDAALATKTAGQWLIGIGYDDSLLAEKRHLNRHDLDQVSSTVPIYIMHVSGHIGVANSIGLKLSGIDKTTVNPEGGVYVKEVNGELTGVLEETARLKTVELAFDLSLLDFIRMSKQGASEYAAAGVTTAQVGYAPKKLMQGIRFVKILNFIPQRLVLWPDMEVGQRWAKGEFDAEQYASDNVTVGAVKLVADGSIQGFTGFLSQPYHSHGLSKGQAHQKDYRGYASMSQPELNRRVMAIHKAGLQVAIHANGDAAIDAVIEAVSKAQIAYPRDDTRHIVVHAQMATQSQLQQMQKWGLTPSFFSAHTYYWGDRHRDIFLGEERAGKISPTHSAQKLNLPFSVHLDTPVVPMNPLLAVWSTVNRISSSGALIGGGERIDVMQALKAVTIDAAWQMFLEKDRGSIEVGKKADLVILDQDPLQKPESIQNMHIIETFVGGVSIYAQ
ncbi:MAG: amidohydrolase [Pseudomonadales bacterium]|nr:amidohydrolase [Pseudomonadales bacterium]